MKKIALLFLTRKELNHPRLWEKLLEGNHEKFNLYIHPKEPLEDPFFKKFQVANPVPTEYFYHGRAWQIMLQEALKDASNEKFVYLSESCSPLYKLEDLYHHLISNSNSYIRYTKPWWPRNSEREIVEIPVEHRWGNHEWVILNRAHAQVIAEDHEILELAARHISSDHEGYPSSLFSLKGCLDEVVYRQTTYAYFNTGPGTPLPFGFYDDEELEAHYLLNAKRGASLFARKFPPEFSSAKLISFALDRLMPLPSAIVSEAASLTPELEMKIIRLQAQEEMSLANSCALIPMLLLEGQCEVCYEIGAGLGLHMERILENVPVKRYYGVDDYRRTIYQGISFSTEEEDRLYAYVGERFSALKLEAELIRADSLELSRQVPDRTVDFIYFNTQHNTIPIEENLPAWFPKLREGGIIAGYQDDTFYPRLSKKVKDFFADKKLEVQQEYAEPKLWWVQLAAIPSEKIPRDTAFG